MISDHVPIFVELDLTNHSTSKEYIEFRNLKAIELSSLLSMERQKEKEQWETTDCL